MQNYLFFLTIRYLCTRKTTKKMKTFLYCAIASAMLLCSCHESIENAPSARPVNTRKETAPLRFSTTCVRIVLSSKWTRGHTIIIVR